MREAPVSTSVLVAVIAGGVIAETAGSLDSVMPGLASAA